jgi:hypothetical protein
MAYRVYAAVVDDGVYANPTTFWLKVGTWEWNTRNYAGASWSIDTSIGGVLLGDVMSYAQALPIPILGEAAYVPYDAPAFPLVYTQDEPIAILHEWIPNLYFQLVTVVAGVTGITNSFYGSVVYTSEADLIRAE